MQLHRELTHYSSKVLFYKFHDTTMEHVDPISLGPWIPSLRPTPFQGLDSCLLFLFPNPSWPTETPR
jgi:hypothetical protein